MVLAAGLNAGQLAPKLETVLKDAPADALIPVIVETRMQADLRSLPPSSSYDDKVAYLKATAAEAQQDLLNWLRSVSVEEVRPFWLVSRVALHAPRRVILDLAARDDVATVWFDDTLRLEPIRPNRTPRDATDGPTWNIDRIKADSCWADGYDGTGIVVGNIDSGVEVTHPAFGGRWREENGWFDAVNGRPTPYDDHEASHGTFSMGLLTGGDGLGSYPYDIGVAPGASFIAAKCLDAQGNGIWSWIEQSLNWMADPGRPDVLSNSWGAAGQDTFCWASIRRLRDLGVIVVFSAGNDGPQPGTVGMPGSFPTVICVGATTYYVATWGNDSNPGTRGRPWRTIQKAAATLVAGDSARVMAGTYDEKIRFANSGIPDDYITLLADDDSVNIVYSGTDDHVVLFTKAYIVLDGFRVSSARYQPVRLNPGSHHVVVRNCELFNTTYHGLVIESDSVHHVTIQNNVIHGHGTSMLHHGMYIKGDYHLIEGNRVYDNAQYGIHLYNGDGSVRHCIVRNNVVHDNGARSANGGGGIIVTQGDNLIYNNVCYGNRGGSNSTSFGISVFNIPAGQGPTVICHNALYDNGNAGLNIQGSNNVILKNNICLDDDQRNLVLSASANIVLDHNCYYPDGPMRFIFERGVYDFTGYQTASGQDSHSFLAEPMFANPNGRDFHLQPGSPCIDTGTGAGVYVDFEGQVRPQGSGFDIGADEYWPPGWVVEKLASETPGSAPGLVPMPSVVRGRLVLTQRGSFHGRLGVTNLDTYLLLDPAGRNVMNLHPGVNDVSRLAPGVYFVRERSAFSAQRSALPSVTKVTVTR